MKISTPVSTHYSHSIDAHIGSRLQSRRELRRLTAAKLAGLIDVSLGALQAIEEGRAEATPKTLLSAADVLNVHPRYFFQNFHSKEVAA